MPENHFFKQFENILCFTTRRMGGVSKEAYNSFNLSPFTGDSAENFKSNLQLLANELAIDLSNFIIPYQTHSDKIVDVDPAFLSLNENQKVNVLNGVDALITSQKGICIGVTTADCVPVFLYDPRNHVTAVAHAGWKGTRLKVAASALHAMTSVYGTRPADVHALLGPSISPEVYKVGEELILEFASAGFDTGKIFRRFPEGLFLDLWKANKLLLEEAGIPAEQIEISGHCTYSDEDSYFSARRLGIKSGRMLSGILLK